MDQKIRDLVKKYLPLRERYNELTEQLESPEIIADNRLYLRLSDERNSLEEAYQLGEALLVAVELGDDREIEALYACLVEELTPAFESDTRSAIIEIRSENPQADPLRQELIKIYSAFSTSHNYTFSIVEDEQKFTTLLIEGKGALSLLKHETGTHRSTGGKIGNSSVWVSVMPKMDDVSVVINDKDLRTDIFHSSGAGGQNINKVATAVRLTHIPTGIQVVCTEERSQLQNRNRAHLVLRSRLYAYYHEKELVARRKNQLSISHIARTHRIRLLDYDNEKILDIRTNLTITLKQAYQGAIQNLTTPLIIKYKR